MAVVEREGLNVGRPFRSGGITRLVRVPDLFAMVTKICHTLWSLTFQLRTTGTTGCYHSIAEKLEAKHTLHTLVSRQSRHTGGCLYT